MFAIGIVAAVARVMLFSSRFAFALALAAVSACTVGDGSPYDDGGDGGDSSDAKANVFGPGHGLNVNPANHESRPCGSLGGAHLHVTGFVRMPLKQKGDNGWSWKTGEFQGYVACLRATLPGIRIIGTMGEASIDPSVGLHNPYYSHACNPSDLDPADCPEFDSWLATYLDKASPTLMKQFDIIEVFNEPDDKWTGGGFKAGTTSSMPPRAYAKLLTAFYDKFRGPIGRPIMMGGMDSGNPGYLAAMGDYESDFVNIHPYGSYPSATPGFSFDRATNTCSSSFGTLTPCFGSTENNITSYRREFEDEGHDGPVLISEWGSKNAKMLPGLIHAFFADPTTRGTNAAMFAYSDANQAGFGLTDGNDVAKPAFGAFAHP